VAFYDVHFIKEEDFKFKAVNMDDSQGETAAKAEKKKDKPKKDGKMPPRDGKMPPPPKR